MGSIEEHTRLVGDCLEELALMGYAAWENERRAVKVNGRWISLGKPGRGDIHVILTARIDGNAGGRLVGIHGEVECKTGTATQRKDQRMHMRVVRNNGGIYILAHSREEMKSQMANLGYHGRIAA